MIYLNTLMSSCYRNTGFFCLKTVTSKLQLKNTTACLLHVYSVHGGCAIFWKRILGHHYNLDKLGSHRISSVSMQLGLSRFCFISCYFPCRGTYRDADYSETIEDLACVISTHLYHKIILAGDFYADLLKPNHRASLIAPMLTQFGMRLSLYHPTDLTYSHPSCSSRIDFIMCSSNADLVDIIVNRGNTMNTSHHAVVMANIDVERTVIIKDDSSDASILL